MKPNSNAIRVRSIGWFRSQWWPKTDKLSIQPHDGRAPAQLKTIVEFLQR